MVAASARPHDLAAVDTEGHVENEHAQSGPTGANNGVDGAAIGVII
jgi:hypothetical protein